MNEVDKIKFKIKILYTIFGVIFGAAFPIGALMFEIYQKSYVLNWNAIVLAHKNNNLIFMIDSAPLFLGIFAYVAGFMRAKSECLNIMLHDELESSKKIQFELESMSIKSNKKSDRLQNILLNISELQKSTIENRNNIKNFTDKSNIDMSKQIIILENNINNLLELNKELYNIITNTKQSADVMNLNTKKVMDSFSIILDKNEKLFQNISEIFERLINFFNIFNFQKEFIEYLVYITKNIKFLSLNCSIEVANLNGNNSNSILEIANKIKKFANLTEDKALYFKDYSRKTMDNISDVVKLLEESKAEFKNSLLSVIVLTNDLKSNLNIIFDVYNHINEIISVSDMQNNNIQLLRENLMAVQENHKTTTDLLDKISISDMNDMQNLLSANENLVS